MSIANSTIDQVTQLDHVLGSTQRTVGQYLGDSRNPGLVSGVDAALAALKTILDAAIADTTVSPDNPNPAIE